VPLVSSALRKRQEGQPQEVVQISWRAQTRLHGRYRRLLGRGKERNRVIVAVARELIGFVWEVWQAVPPGDASAPDAAVAA
jgi:transposase